MDKQVLVSSTCQKNIIIKVELEKVKHMVQAKLYGQTNHLILEMQVMEKHQEWVNSSFLDKAYNMMVNGLMDLLVLEFYFMMAISIKQLSKRLANQQLNLKMVPYIQERSLKKIKSIYYKEKVKCYLQMAHIMKVFGNKDTCMEEVLLYGERVIKNIKAIITLEKNRDMENITTIKINGMKECGKMESSMVKVQSSKMERKLLLEDGKKDLLSQLLHRVASNDILNDLFFSMNSLINQCLQIDCC